MHEPTARVIRLECDDNEATSRQQHYVPSWRIVKFEVKTAWVVLLTLDLLKDGKIVTVKVDLIRCDELPSSCLTPQRKT